MSKRNSYTNSNYKNSSKRRGVKKWLSIICAFLAGLVLCGAITSVTAEKELNEDNLIKADNYFENLVEETDGGLKIKWKDDGRFVLTGKHSDDNIANNALYSVAFTTVTLNEGTYTFTPGNDNCGDETYGMYYKINGGEPVYVFANKAVITVESTSAVEFGFYIKNNYHILYAEFAPVIVSGDKIGTFFAEN